MSFSLSTVSVVTPFLETLFVYLLQSVLDHSWKTLLYDRLHALDRLVTG